MPFNTFVSTNTIEVLPCTDFGLCCVRMSVCVCVCVCLELLELSTGCPGELALHLRGHQESQ